MSDQKPSASTERLAAVEDKVDSVGGALMSLGRKMLGSQVLSLLIAAGSLIGVTLYARESQAQQVEVRIVETTAALRAEMDALKARQAADASATQYELGKLRGDVGDVKDEQRGLRQDLRALFPALPKLSRDAGP